jgi:hypothetical protein
VTKLLRAWRGELPYYLITLALVLFGFHRLLNPADPPPRVQTLPDTTATVVRGKLRPINVWLAPHGPHCKAPDGWKIVATAKYGSTNILSLPRTITNSVHENCNGQPIEAVLLQYSSPWFLSYDEITVQMQTADAIVWRTRYIVTIVKAP